MMELVRKFVDIFLHLDKHLTQVTSDYGTWTYAILFLIVFCETGLVVTPILPGDSLLFAAGAISALGSLNVWLMGVMLIVAAVLGDMVNYWAGHYFGARIFKPDAKILKTEYLVRTQHFYEKYGAKTIVLCRFVPIIRTFAPFVAGMGRMRYARFFSYNVIGAIAWVVICLAAGFFFGNIPVVQKNFSLVVLAIIFLSILPAIIGIIQHRRSPPPVPPAPVI
jgi:membrane-associated protein